jgi:hypothetical protein
MEVSGKIHAPAALSPEREVTYAFDRRVGGLQTRFGLCGEEKNLLFLLGIQPRLSSP